MNALEQYKAILKSHEMMALATSVKEQANVRIVNFITSDDSSVLYFASFKGNPKTMELEQNNKISFTTIPLKGIAHVRTTSAVVVKSEKSMQSMAKKFIEQIPSYKDILDMGMDALILYEIRIESATVTLDVDRTFDIKLS